MKLQFKSTAESLPKHGEYIVYIKLSRESFYSPTPMFDYAGCVWTWRSEDEGFCGHTTDCTLANPPEDYPFLNIQNRNGDTLWSNHTNKYNPDIEHVWWMSQEDFDNAFIDAEHEVVI
jgi:hypothetical protein